MHRTRHHYKLQHGFTLVELAIVLVIVGLLIGGMVLSLAAQQDNANLKETQRRVTQAYDALLGFAAANGRLPCPASPPPAGGSEAPVNTGACTNPLDGFVPAITLGLGPTDAQGYLVDAWGNPVRYAVYSASIATKTNPFTEANKMRTIGMETLSLQSLGPPPVPRQLLFVCDSGSGIGTSDCGTAKTLSDSAVAVVYSRGKNGIDEANGGVSDVVFVNAIATNFDDVVTWLSPNILFNRMIAAGRLP